MIRYECDRCGKRLLDGDAGRFIVKIEIYAAAEHLDLADRTVDAAALDGILEQLASAHPDDVEDRTYRCLRFDVCDACRKVFLQRPLV